MSSNRTKRRRIREELDFVLYEVLYESDNVDENCAKNNTDFINIQNENTPVQLPNTSEICPAKNKNISIQLDNIPETSILGSTDNYSHCDSLLIPTLVPTADLCSEVKCRLVEWVVNFNVPQNTINGLLPIFKSIPGFSEIPIDSRTILKTETTLELTQDLKIIEPGFYYHFGLGSAIEQHFHHTDIGDTDVIKVVIGIDGLPLSKSSCSQFWPILGYIRPLQNLVFPIGIYWGHEKPKDSNEFLRDFVYEVNTLMRFGININGTNKQVEIDGFSLDAPAKSFVLKIKGHSGFDSCTRCTVEGEYPEEYLKNRTC